MVTVDAIVYSIAPAGGIAVQFNELLKRLPVHGINFEAYRFCREGLNFPTLALPPRRLERYRRFAHPAVGDFVPFHILPAALTKTPQCDHHRP